MKRPRSALQHGLAKRADKAELLREKLLTLKPKAKRIDINVHGLVETIGALAPERHVRDPSSRPFAFKTKDIGKIRLVIAHHLYGAYPVPKHLEAIWHDTQQPLLFRPPSTRYGERPARLTVADVERRRHWYITAASGGSLYKAHTHHFLTKRETHVFSTLSLDLTFEQALIFAMARSHTDDIALCRRLAMTKLAAKEYVVDEQTSPRWRRDAVFWKDAIRFFCVNPIAGSEVDDLVDFFAHARRRQDCNYDLKGRTLRSVTAAMHDWHADLGRLSRIGDHRWDGLAIPNGLLIKVKSDDATLDWQFSQVTSSKGLAEEGNAMRHCVYTYQAACRQGSASIWSMRSRHSGSGAAFARKITFEIKSASRRIVQVRGYANRRPNETEIAALRRWADENGIGISSYAWS